MTMKYTFLLLIMLIISVPLHAQDNAAAGNVMPEISAEEFDKMTKEEQSEFLKKQEEAVLKAVKEEENNQEKEKKNENIEESAIMQSNEVKEKYSQPDEKEPAQAAKTEQKGKRTIPRKKQTIKKTALSGIVLMPTAYRGTGTNEIGPGLDINAAYIIGRLYGKNTYDWTLEKKDYLDRIGLWILSADGKLQVQTEGKYRPAVAAGLQGIFSFRDSSNPTLKTNQDLKVDAKSNNSYANAYVAMSKRLGNKFIINAGYSDGDMPKMINAFSEYLSPEARMQNGILSPKDATGMIFGGFIWLPKPDSPISVEFMLPQGAQMSPKLLNLHLGTLLKLNFEISYLKFQGGWDLLGVFQFRYNYWP